MAFHLAPLSQQSKRGGARPSGKSRARGSGGGGGGNPGLILTFLGVLSSPSAGEEREGEVFPLRLALRPPRAYPGVPRSDKDGGAGCPGLPCGRCLGASSAPRAPFGGQLGPAREPAEAPRVPPSPLGRPRGRTDAPAPVALPRPPEAIAPREAFSSARRRRSAQAEVRAPPRMRRPAMQPPWLLPAAAAGRSRRDDRRGTLPTPKLGRGSVLRGSPPCLFPKDADDARVAAPLSSGGRGGARYGALSPQMRGLARPVSTSPFAHFFSLHRPLRRPCKG